jgi:hypothetical protein
MQSQFGFVPFDLKILLSLARLEPGDDLQFAPPFPLLTQGWSLLQATHESLPEELKNLSEHYRNTTWTHLDSQGIKLCQSYLSRQTTNGTSGQSGNATEAVEKQPVGIVFVETAVDLDFEPPTALLGDAVEIAFEPLISQASTVDEEERGLEMSE